MCKAITTLMLVALIAACSRESAELHFANPISSVDREIISDLAELFRKESDLDISLTADEMSGEAALDAVLAGEADLALVSNALPYRSGIATVIPLYPTVLHIGYFEGREFTDIVDLVRGAKVYAGAEGSASRRMFDQSAVRFGLDENDYSFVSSSEARPDVIVVFAPVSRGLLDRIPDLRLFSLGSPEDVGTGSPVDSATLLNPYLKPFVIPVGTYGDATTEPILTVAVDKMLVARRDLKASVVYEFISELLRLRPALAAKRPGLFSELSGDFDASNSTFVLHSGAQAYLERSEPTIYERYSGIAEVGVTILIALISALFGGIRLYQMKRKNRIDAYYTETLALRDSVSKSTSDEDRQLLVGQLRELQNRAFEELVDEKLAADDSFRIFITLSNDVLRQLGANSDESILPGA
jgi:TRAP-type uncharacterized transport system substrate-binding protein